MNANSFDFFRQLILRKSGLVIEPERLYLLEARLKALSQTLGFHNIETLILAMLQSSNDELENSIVEAMTTNETYFFRDIKLFNQLKTEIFPQLLTKQQYGHLKIWSAACSSGQELYSIAMTLHDVFQKPGWLFQLIGTDISPKMIDYAQKGLYTQFEIQRGLPVPYLLKYFTKQDGQWQINGILKQMCQFKISNLIETMAITDKFDVILCRNILIYFNFETKIKVLKYVINHLSPHGYLILGISESIFGLDIDIPMYAHPTIPGIYSKQPF